MSDLQEQTVYSLNELNVDDDNHEQFLNANPEFVDFNPKDKTTTKIINRVQQYQDSGLLQCTVNSQSKTHLSIKTNSSDDGLCPLIEVETQEDEIKHKAHIFPRELKLNNKGKISKNKSISTENAQVFTGSCLFGVHGAYGITSKGNKRSICNSSLEISEDPEDMICELDIDASL